MGSLIAFILTATSWLTFFLLPALAYNLGGVWAAVFGLVIAFCFLVWAHDYEVRERHRRGPDRYPPA